MKDSVREKIDGGFRGRKGSLPEVMKEFESRDRHKSGHVSASRFEKVLADLKDRCRQEELDFLVRGLERRSPFL
jgi:hypothetical protein